MTEKSGDKKEKKGFFSRMLEKLDKKLEEKARENKCCSSDKGKGKSCCS